MGALIVIYNVTSRGQTWLSHVIWLQVMILWLCSRTAVLYINSGILSFVLFFFFFTNCMLRDNINKYIILSVFVQLILPFQEDSAVLVEENTDIPDYLPEEESPSQETDKAVTRVGSITDGVGWLSTAANFLTRSFYWWPLPAFLSLLPVFSKVPSSCSLSVSKPCPGLSPASQHYTSLDSHLLSTQNPATCVQQVLDCQVEPAITLTCVNIELQIPLLAVCATTTY